MTVFSDLPTFYLHAPAPWVKSSPEGNIFHYHHIPDGTKLQQGVLSTSPQTPCPALQAAQLEKHKHLWASEAKHHHQSHSQQVAATLVSQDRLKKLKREQKFIARLHSKNYRLCSNTGCPEYHSFSWRVFCCFYSVFTQQRQCLCHLSSPKLCTTEVQTAYSFKAANWWNSANAACLKRAAFFQSDLRRHSGAPALTPLSRAHGLLWNSASLSANPTLLALPDPYGYTPTNTGTILGGSSYLWEMSVCLYP